MIGEITEESPACQTRHVTGGKNPEHRKGGGELVLARKEKKTERRGQHAVEGEIVPLHQVAGHGGERGRGREVVGGLVGRTHPRIIGNCGENRKEVPSEEGKGALSDATPGSQPSWANTSPIP